MTREKLIPLLVFLLPCFFIIVSVYKKHLSDVYDRSFGKSHLLAPEVMRYDNHEDQRKNIYISASFRSGSSFLGSIFDQNPDFLYEWL